MPRTDCVLLAALGILAPWPLRAQQPERAHEAIAALDELIAATTTGPRRGELHDLLVTADFAVFARRLTQLRASRGMRSAFGSMSATPWLEERLHLEDRITSTLDAVWNAHLRPPVSPQTARVLVDLLEDADLADFRTAVLGALLGTSALAEDDAFARATLPRLDRLARVDGSSLLRASLMPVLIEASDPNCHHEVAIEIARTGEDARRECDLLLRTGVLSHLGGLLPAARSVTVRYALDLLRRCDDGKSGGAFPLASAIAAGLDPADPRRGALFAPPSVMGETKGQMTTQYMQEVVNRALAWSARNGRGESGNAAAIRPIVALPTLVVSRVSGRSTATCRSNWHSLRDLKLVAAGTLAVGPAELVPLLPPEPIEIGTVWTVPGERVAGLAAALADVEWREHSPDSAAWSAFCGELQYERTIAAQGELTGKLEQRPEGRGIAVAGTLRVSDAVRIGRRFGPNHKSTTATHTIRAWLLLDDLDCVVAVELQDDVELTGTYGTAGQGEAFTQRSSFATAGVAVPTADEERTGRELLAGLDHASADVRTAAERRLVALGRTIAPLLVAACRAESDYVRKRRLGVILKMLR